MLVCASVCVSVCCDLEGVCFKCAHTHARIYIYIICMQVCVCMHIVYMCVYTYICIYVGVHVCVCVYVVECIRVRGYARVSSCVWLCLAAFQTHLVRSDPVTEDPDPIWIGARYGLDTMAIQISVQYRFMQ